MTSLRLSLFAPVLALAALSFASTAQAVEYCSDITLVCVELPAGDISFADEVISYSPAGTLAAVVQVTSEALGAPDTDVASLTPCALEVDCNFLTLGNGGQAVFRFNDNVLTGSNDSEADLYIFETGPFTQGMDVYISKDGVDWTSVGTVIGGTSSIDIDPFISDYRDPYRYVRIDDDNVISDEEIDETSTVAGADIDAVGAISAAARNVQLHQHVLTWLDNLNETDRLARARTVGNPAVFVDYHDVDTDDTAEDAFQWRFYPSDTMIVDVATLPRFDETNRPYVGVLAVNQITGIVDVKLKDSSDGTLLSRVTFDNNFTPYWLRAFGNTGLDDPYLVVLGVDSNGVPRAQIKESTSGDLKSLVYFDPEFVPFGFTIVEDINGGQVELVIFGINDAGQVRAQMKDAITGDLVGYVWFDKNFAPIAGVGLDTDNDLVNDALVVLGSNDAGNVQAQVKDSDGGARTGLIQFDRGAGPMRMAALSSAAGFGVEALAVLSQDATGLTKAQVKNASTGDTISVITFHPGSTPIDFIAIPDVDSSSYWELAYLGTNDEEGAFLQVKDAFSGMLVYRKNISD